MPDVLIHRRVGPCSKHKSAGFTTDGRCAECHREYMRSSWRRKLKNKSRPNRHRKNPNAKLAEVLRGRIKSGLFGHTKSARTSVLLGCTVDFARSWLEQQFTSGMTWANHGSVWHIDHIRPFASFDNLEDPWQQRQVCNYKNLQPLFGSDNLSKSSFYNGKRHRNYGKRS